MMDFKNYSLINTGQFNNGGYVFNNVTMIFRTTKPLKEDIVSRINKVHDLGANIPQILEQKQMCDVNVQLMTTMTGKNLNLKSAQDGVAKANYSFLNASKEQFIKFLRDLKLLNRYELGFDAYGDNLFYDRQKGFGMVDIDLDRLNKIYVNRIVDFFEVKKLSKQLSEEKFNAIIPLVQEVQKEYGKKKIEDICI